MTLANRMTDQEKEHADLGRYPLVLAEDCGGRFFLRGKPVHCGTQLELWCPGLAVTIEGKPYGDGCWIPVRFEMEDGRPKVYVWLGSHVGEGRFDVWGDQSFRWPERRTA